MHTTLAISSTRPTQQSNQRQAILINPNRRRITHHPKVHPDARRQRNRQRPNHTRRSTTINRQRPRRKSAGRTISHIIPIHRLNIQTRQTNRFIHHSPQYHARRHRQHRLKRQRYTTILCSVKPNRKHQASGPMPKSHTTNGPTRLHLKPSSKINFHLTRPRNKQATNRRHQRTFTQYPTKIHTSIFSNTRPTNRRTNRPRPKRSH